VAQVRLDLDLAAQLVLHAGLQQLATWVVAMRSWMPIDTLVLAL
jgi:hypothetical protein